MILWLNHTGITTRSVEDTALVLEVLAEQSKEKSSRFFDELAKGKKLRIGVANNFKADREVEATFDEAVETIRRLGYSVSSAAAPFGDPSRGIGNIRADRKAIAVQAFKDIDIS